MQRVVQNQTLNYRIDADFAVGSGRPAKANSIKDQEFSPVNLIILRIISTQAAGYSPIAVSAESIR